MVVQQGTHIVIRGMIVAHRGGRIVHGPPRCKMRASLRQTRASSQGSGADAREELAHRGQPLVVRRNRGAAERQVQVRQHQLKVQLPRNLQHSTLTSDSACELSVLHRVLECTRLTLRAKFAQTARRHCSTPRGHMSERDRTGSSQIIQGVGTRRGGPVV